MASFPNVPLHPMQLAQLNLMYPMPPNQLMLAGGVNMSQAMWSQSNIPFPFMPQMVMPIQSPPFGYYSPALSGGMPIPVTSSPPDTMSSLVHSVNQLSLGTSEAEYLTGKPGFPTSKTSTAGETRGFSSVFGFEAAPVPVKEGHICG
jgi:hypothetical protein